MLVRLRSTVRLNGPTQPTRNAALLSHKTPHLARLKTINSAPATRCLSPKVQFSTQSSPSSNLPSYVETIQKLSKDMDMKKAQKQFQRMQAEGIVPTVEVYNAMLGGYQELHDVQQFTELWKQMVTTDIKPNVESYTIYMRLALEKDYYKMVEHIYDTMKKEGVQPNADTYALLMKMNGEAGYVEDTVKFMEEMKAQGIQPDERHYVAIMQAHILLRKMEDAVAVFNQMKEQGVSPTVITYHLFIRSLQQTHHYDELLQWFTAFEATGQRVPSGIYMSVIDAYEHLGNKEKAAYYLERMKAT